MKTISTSEFNISESEKQTAIYLLQDLTVKQIAGLRCLSFAAVQRQTMQIRTKMETTTIYAALARMIAARIIAWEELVSCVSQRQKHELF
jgi:hypothetical protein